MTKITEVTYHDSKKPDSSSRLTLLIDESGEIVFEGCERGNTVEDQRETNEYEYSLSVESEYKDTILLHLIRERFGDESEFRAWLQMKGIPSRFFNLT